MVVSPGASHSLQWERSPTQAVTGKSVKGTKAPATSSLGISSDHLSKMPEHLHNSALRRSREF